MGRTAEESGNSDGLSDETVAAAVYASVLGIANAEAWRDRLNRADYDDIFESASRSAMGSGRARAQAAAVGGWDSTNAYAGEIHPTSALSAADDLTGPVLIRRHFDRAIYLRSRLVAAQNHGFWPELQTVLPCGDRNWALVSHEAEVLAARGDWPSSGRVTDLPISKSLQVTDADLPKWRNLFDADAQRPALVLLRTAGGHLLMCQPLDGRADLPLHSLGAAYLAAPALLVEQVQTAWSDMAATLIANWFGFDPQEMSLLRHLLTGDDWVELGIGKGGQRDPELAVLRGMLTKTAAPSCPEMLRFLAHLIAQTVEDYKIAAGVASPPQKWLSLPCGLSSRYLRFGAARGQAVIFVHGIFDGIAGMQRLQPMLRARGLQVLAPLRCGYGGSDRLPRQADPVDLFITQLEALIDTEGLERPILLGHRSGCVFTAAAARRLRDRLGGVVGVGATLPLPSIGQAGALRGHQRAMALSAVHAKAVLPLVVRSWSRSVRQKGPQVLVSRQIAKDSADRRLLADPGLSAVLEQSHRMMMQHGRGGYETDLRLAARPRDTRHSAKAAPTIYLHGGEDTVTPAERLQAALGPGSADLQIRISKRAGTMLLYAQPELVFAAIEDLRQRIPS
ncbi:putative hydrolase or acyltransferase (alpha/beta hydrolase superfamily) [Phaeobacter gallaeciensis]|nr:putative hydrolase or acyltransferase (alpha/beta hydrolase superfamily) [Phaeobacter gallaeciensis]ATF23394.1 putative hydrolase or acyltransferase (alpha/beta hydrolase superfamily) [Phaeobacter gallaeciensis]